jgi:hypothetical protein
MPDFGSSFEAGLAAARAAQSARAEVKAVLAEFNAQLGPVSTDAALLALIHGEEAVRPPKSAIERMAVAGGLYGETRPFMALAIVHRTAKDFGQREIARWRQHDLGYPVWISGDSYEVACGDRQSFEEQLSKLAATPRFGEAVLAAMAHQSKSAAKNSLSSSAPSASPTSSSPPPAGSPT